MTNKWNRIILPLGVIRLLAVYTCYEHRTDRSYCSNCTVLPICLWCCVLYMRTSGGAKARTRAHQHCVFMLLHLANFPTMFFAYTWQRHFINENSTFSRTVHSIKSNLCNGFRTANLNSALWLDSFTPHRICVILCQFWKQAKINIDTLSLSLFRSISLSPFLSRFQIYSLKLIFSTCFRSTSNLICIVSFYFRL